MSASATPTGGVANPKWNLLVKRENRKNKKSRDSIVSERWPEMRLPKIRRAGALRTQA